MPLEQAVLEHHTLGTVDTADGPRTRVVLVAARRDMIEKLLEATRRPGCAHTASTSPRSR